MAKRLPCAKRQRCAKRLPWAALQALARVGGEVGDMIQIVWQYVVKDEARAKFELAYGRGGAWSDLFSTCPGYRGTALLRDTSDPRKYLTVDSWDSEADRQAMLAERQDEYAALDATFQEWTESEVELGTYRLLAEATVRPRGRRR